MKPMPRGLVSTRTRVGGARERREYPFYRPTGRVVTRGPRLDAAPSAWGDDSYAPDQIRIFRRFPDRVEHWEPWKPRERERGVRFRAAKQLQRARRVTEYGVDRHKSVLRDVPMAGGVL